MNNKLIATLLITASITACSNMNSSQQSTLSGGAIGAAAGTAGALIFNGNPIWGAVGGAAVGAIAGYAIDQSHKKPQASGGTKPGKGTSSGGSTSAN
ncbi:hypothetical protein [Polynucleobacter sp. MWH-UH23A]|uniref:hypothetical protein n=1 Tax=Polynucleobacter sp. MWH-UH23A TaxID=1855613 RepID=UPI003364F882